MASLFIPSRNALFLHLPKTAGYSVSTALAEAFPDTQSYPVRDMSRAESAASYLGERLDPAVFARTWSFCFVRNPWDWAVSGWLHVTRNTGAYGDSPPSFAEFLTGSWDQGLKRNPNPRKFNSPQTFVAYHTQLTQSEHLAGRNGEDPVPLAFYARFEQLSQDWARICDRLGRAISLPHQNKSQRGHYTDYYTDPLREIVARRNAALIARFGYAFGE
ncbi:sulfotransferase family 2 domain-containing protein [Pseudoroseicyclus tamaricis]|uniref:Sulfotransferase family protein n=1 Tax=Pseudoroseicyclus tamaricis TaxID=2705421 RepID=A0A6B2JV74_9RHOB|nr:sulfotransferase family 2 domain-containing protein [Pseudoroseicyclus tamaricis]NDV00529.1 sulfotransferase family protein [Pseudoroseicyclus tamaricis]